MAATYTPLESKLFSQIDSKASSFSMDSASLSATTSLIATLFFMLIGGAAFYRFTMAGVYRLEASENGVRKSNEAFKAATLGVLGVFLMFLIFFAVNRDLLSSDVGLSTLKLPPASQSAGSAGSAGGAGAGVPSGPLPTGACVRSSCTAADLPRVTGANDASVRNTLQNAGIVINVSACTSISQGGCTNVGGMPDEVVNMLKSLKTACNCNVTVSGGTEWWSHSSHGPGVLVVDLQIPRLSNGTPDLSNALYKFISSQTNVGSSGGCHSIYSWSGWTFCDEKTGSNAFSTNRHWHVKK